MITLQDLDTAIAKCQGLADPKPTDAIKLAAFYIIKNEMYGRQEQDADTRQIEPSYSYSAEPENHIEKTIDYFSDTEFSQVIDGKNASDVWAVMDELMSVLQATNPRLYKGVINKIAEQ